MLPLSSVEAKIFSFEAKICIFIWQCKRQLERPITLLLDRNQLLADIVGNVHELFLEIIYRISGSIFNEQLFHEITIQNPSHFPVSYTFVATRLLFTHSLHRSDGDCRTIKYDFLILERIKTLVDPDGEKRKVMWDCERRLVDA